MWLSHFDISLLWRSSPFSTFDLSFYTITTINFIRKIERGSGQADFRSEKKGHTATQKRPLSWWSLESPGHTRESPWGSSSRTSSCLLPGKKGSAEKKVYRPAPLLTSWDGRRRQDGRVFHPPCPLHRHLWRRGHSTAHICAQKPLPRVRQTASKRDNFDNLMTNQNCSFACIWLDDFLLTGLCKCRCFWLACACGSSGSSRTWPRWTLWSDPSWTKELSSPSSTTGA